MATHASRLQLGDRLFHALCLVMAWSVPVLTLLMVYILAQRSLPSLRRFGFLFLISSQWNVQAEQFGALPFICGTLIVSALAMLFAVPLGVGAAAFLAEVAPAWMRRTATFLVELLAAIPSVVYGFWGIVFLQGILHPLLHRLGAANDTGKGLFTAGLLLSIMIVPYITAISYDVCRAVPSAQRQAALALGATRWQMIWSVVLPYARPGIVGACFLALGRALGETMAVIMVIGNSYKLPHSVFDLGASIPSVIASQLSGSSTELWYSSLVELGLVLFLVTVLVNCLARLLIWRVGQSDGYGFFRWRRRPTAPASTPSTDKGSPIPALLDNGRGELALRVSALSNRMAQLLNKTMTVILGACLVLILIPLFHILGYVLFKGAGDLNGVFFTNVPADEPPGLANALVGTAAMVGLASLLAVPVGILAAIYLSEYRTSWLAPVVRFVTELLGGVPSIIIGIFAYVLVVAPFKHVSAWAGAFALAVMMLPLIIRASEEALKLVPGTLRNASYALGASHWQTVVRVVVPAALPAIITSVFLAVARIAGETAPLLFTAGTSDFWPHSLNQETPYLTWFIYYGSTLTNSPVYQRLAWAAAVVLLGIVMALNIGIRLLAGKRVVQASRAE